MDIKVTKKGWEIINSGYIIVNDGEIVEFNIDGLLFRLSFETVPDAEPRVGYGMLKEQEGQSYMFIKCENFDNSMLRTTNDPLILAKKDGRNIAFQLTTSSLLRNNVGEGQVSVENKVLFYCWMMELPK